MQQAVIEVRQCRFSMRSSLQISFSTFPHSLYAKVEQTTEASGDQAYDDRGLFGAVPTQARVSGRELYEAGSGRYTLL
jgi:hypothetical protein